VELLLPRDSAPDLANNREALWVVGSKLDRDLVPFALNAIERTNRERPADLCSAIGFNEEMKTRIALGQVGANLFNELRLFFVPGARHPPRHHGRVPPRDSRT
jgi:hypothetical protein